MELRPSDLESLLPEGHRARMVWGYLERQDLSAMYDQGTGRWKSLCIIHLALYPNLSSPTNSAEEPRKRAFEIPIRIRSGDEVGR